MTRTTNTFRSFLSNKFGDHVIHALLEPERLQLRFGEAKSLYRNDRQTENQQQVGQLMSGLPQNVPWAFDFPGWMGELEFSGNQPAREIMVIGMEPHIEGCDFQVTYGFRETQPGNYDEIGLGNNERLWRHVNDLLGADGSSHGPSLYKRVYITDMCHFAPKGAAKQVLGIQNWKKIRNSVASDFLKTEIQYILPTYIISSGRDVAGFVDSQILKPMAEVSAWKSRESLQQYRSRWSFLTRYMYEGRPIIHIGVPHLASGQTAGIWNKMDKQGIKNEITALLNL